MSIAKISLALVLYISLTPFIYFDKIFNGYEYPKFIYFLFGTFLFSLAFLISSGKFKKSIKISKVYLVLLLFLGLIFTADILGLDPRVSFLGSLYRKQGFITLFAGVILFFLVSFWAQIDHDFKKKLFTGITISTFILSVVTILLYIGRVILGNTMIPSFDERVVATMGNPNFLGGYLVMTFPILLLFDYKSLFVKNYSRIKRLAILVSSVAIILTGSRSAILALAIIILAFFMVKFLRKKVLKIFFIAGSIVVVLGLVIILPQRQSLYENRTIIWKDGVEAVMKQPILGYGQENFELIFHTNRFMKVDSAHNLLLEFAVGGGLLSLGAFLLFFILVFKKAALTVRLCLVAFLIVASFNPISIALWLLFWTLTGISASEE